MFLAPTTGLNCLWEAHATARAFIYYRRPIKLFRKKRDRQRDPIVYLNNFCCNGNGRKLMLIGLRIFVSNQQNRLWTSIHIPSDSYLLDIHLQISNGHVIVHWTSEYKYAVDIPGCMDTKQKIHLNIVLSIDDNNYNI